MLRELPDVQAGFRKGRGTRDQIANIRWIIEKAREFQGCILYILISSYIACVCVQTQYRKKTERDAGACLRNETDIIGMGNHFWFLLFTLYASVLFVCFSNIHVALII